MFVRRIATVTISAPDATIADRVAAKSLYLPVPTRRRERKACPAMTSGSSWASAIFSVGAFIFGDLTAADGGDHFDSIAGADHGIGVPAAWDDLTILFYRDA